MFAVSPKLDCPHWEKKLDLHIITNRIDELMTHEANFTIPCKKCGDSTENWWCLECYELHCSRYVNSHMAEHNSSTSHEIAVSFSDASIWCYSCDSYIDSTELSLARRKFGQVKFARGVDHLDHHSSLTTVLPPIEEAEMEEGDVEDDVKDRDVGGSSIQPGPDTYFSMDEDNNCKDGDDDEEDDDNDDDTDFEDIVGLAKVSTPSFSYVQLVEGIKQRLYRKVVFLTGAGISVAAGIPDFRTPGTGLYSKMKELDLPYPEAIFGLEYLQSRPQAFYKMANGFLTYKASPVKAHRFIKKVADEGMLLMNFTQNIDGLEVDAGLPMEYLVQAHGHMRSAHCSCCKAVAPIEAFFEHVGREEVLYCNDCHGGVVKPDIVFFGENLPQDFFLKMNLMYSADLVFIMGTSLKVFPFTTLIELVARGVPIVLINRENPGLSRKDPEDLLFLAGEIEETIATLARDVGWDIESFLDAA